MRKFRVRAWPLLLGGALALSASAATPEEKCSITKTKAAGAYAACRQKAAAKSIQKGTEPAYGKCDDKFQKGWDKAEAKAAKKDTACVDGVASEDVRQVVAGNTDAVASALSGLAPECVGPYVTLDRENRNVAATAGTLCDDFSANTSPQWQGSGWYRFDGAAGTRMPESAPPAGACSTDARGWLNGTHPEVSEGVVTRDLCYALAGEDCAGGVFVDGLPVVNCGAFYLYNLPTIGSCNYRYCAE